MIEIKPPWGDDRNEFETWLYHVYKQRQNGGDPVTPNDDISNQECQDIIKAALSQCTLHVPLEWEERIDGSWRAKGNLFVLDCWSIDDKWNLMINHTQSPEYSLFPTLEAAKQAAQDWVNKQVNGGE